MADELQSREGLERLRAAGKRRANAEIVRAVEDRLPRLLDRVSRDADQTFWSDDPSRFTDGQFILSDVNAIGFREDRDVGPVVHNE